MKSTFTSIVLRTANIPAFIVYPFDTLYHSFLIYSKPFRRSMYILFSRASRSVYDRTKITNCWLKGFTNLLFFCPIILNSVFMKYQVLFEHPCLQMKRYFCSTLMLSAWWENRTDQPGAQYHFIITDRLFLWCNAPISLSFFVSLCRKYCVLTVNFEK